MTAKREIQQWLKDGMPIRAGISLYEKYGNNPNIRRRILTVQDKRILRSILDNELRIIAGISVLPAPQKQRPSKKRIKPAENPAAIPTVVPDKLKPIYSRKKKLYVQARNLHSKLCYSNDVAARAAMAARILDMWDEINQCWKQIDYYNQHKRLPDPELEVPTPTIKADTSDPIGLDRRRRTLKTYLSKGKKDPERNQQNMIDWQAEIDAIEKILKHG